MKIRQEAVQIARSWIGTPYVRSGRLKGSGVDCGTLLLCYLVEIGAASHDENIPVFSDDWFSHATEESYKYRLMKHARKIAETVCVGRPDAMPGDLVLFRVVGSRVYNHGAIVTVWPKGIHALAGEGVREVNLAEHALTGHKEMAIFSPWK